MGTIRTTRAAVGMTLVAMKVMVAVVARRRLGNRRRFLRRTSCDFVRLFPDRRDGLLVSSRGRMRLGLMFAIARQDRGLNGRDRKPESDANEEGGCGQHQAQGNHLPNRISPNSGN